VTTNDAAVDFGTEPGVCSRNDDYHTDFWLARRGGFVKKLILVVLAVGLPFVLAGCAPEIIRAGAERDAVLYGSQIELARAKAAGQRPACLFVAAPGEDIAFAGIERIECWASEGGSGEVEIVQRVSPVWNFMSQNAGILGILGWSAIMYPDGISSGVQTVTTPAPEVVRPEVVNPLVVR
jgi:hypothetical protein